MESSRIVFRTQHLAQTGSQRQFPLEDRPQHALYPELPFERLLAEVLAGPLDGIARMAVRTLVVFRLRAVPCMLLVLFHRRGRCWDDHELRGLLVHLVLRFAHVPSGHDTLGVAAAEKDGDRQRTLKKDKDR